MAVSTTSSARPVVNTRVPTPTHSAETSPVDSFPVFSVESEQGSWVASIISMASSLTPAGHAGHKQQRAKSPIREAKRRGALGLFD
ncbi:hypothetical protein FRC03_004482 [Tulasnella sp. 419]|nr:hypothetical protein FRC02_011769 [Tulasnella sp. 418]KAG8962218.1 hypothetical protein FRC03_004482 [Tulasnella sp. 419]